MTVNRETEANAARIVACVNACEGIADPSVVPALLTALKNLTSGEVSNKARQQYWDDARAAIARAEGKAVKS